MRGDVPLTQPLGDQAGVRAILYTQTKNIIEEAHQKHLTQMQEVVEQERWERTDVPAPYNKILEQLVGKEQLPEDELHESGL